MELILIFVFSSLVIGVANAEPIVPSQKLQNKEIIINTKEKRNSKER